MVVKRHCAGTWPNFRTIFISIICCGRSKNSTDSNEVLTTLPRLYADEQTIKVSTGSWTWVPTRQLLQIVSLVDFCTPVDAENSDLACWVIAPMLSIYWHKHLNLCLFPYFWQIAFFVFTSKTSCQRMGRLKIVERFPPRNNFYEVTWLILKNHLEQGNDPNAMTSFLLGCCISQVNLIQIFFCIMRAASYSCRAKASVEPRIRFEPSESTHSRR